MASIPVLIANLDLLGLAPALDATRQSYYFKMSSQHFPQSVVERVMA
jgi:hypothetical protein